MNLEPVINRLSQLAAPVFLLGEDSEQTSIDTSELLCTILNDAALETSFFKSDDNAPDTHCVINMVSHGPLELDSRKIANSDVFVAEIRAKDRNISFENVAHVKEHIEKANYALEITDWLQDYDVASESYRQNLEITFTVPRSDSASVPAILIYEIATTGDPIETANRPRQRLNERFAVLLMTNGAAYKKLINDIRDRLIGWCPSNTHEPLELKSSHPLEAAGNMRMYRFEFESSHTFKCV